MMKRIRIGVDVGGTFTDLVLVDERRDQIFTGKQLTTRHDPSQAICEGVQRIVLEAGLDMDSVGGIIHGTTLVTNTLIERDGALIGLITTRGFRDVLEIGHEMRYDLYDLFMEKPEPLAERKLRKAVTERITAQGEILTALDEDELVAAGQELVDAGVEAIAVCFLHSYANPVHEQKAAELLEARFSVPVTVSTVVAPEIREYERSCTVAANAYVLPLMRRYITELHEKLQALGLRGPLNVMLSGGGIASLKVAQQAPIQLIESGPAAGAISGAFYGDLTGSDYVIAFDMGGTTAKMCLIEHGEPEHSRTFEAGRVRRFRQGSGIPLKVPVIDLIEIGAGGGSIARLDGMGLLKVGPDSAGSAPGPVCYGQGGKDPTVTDADLMLGYLSPDYFLGGEIKLDMTAVESAVENRLARPAGLSTMQMAAGIHAVVNNNMAAATRRYIAEKGRDPRRYTLVATGGAGPVHAYGLARELKISRIICPFAAGVSSALGFLIAPPATEGVRSYISGLDVLDLAHIEKLYGEITGETTEQLLAAGADPAMLKMRRTVEMRYVGQGFEIEVPVPEDFSGSEQFGAALRDAFLRKYDQLFGRRIEGVPIEAVSWRLSVAGVKPDIKLHFEGQQIVRGAALKGERLVHFPDYGSVPTKIYNRYGLAAGTSFEGPAVIEERESTVVAGPDSIVTVDPYLNLIIDINYQRDSEKGAAR